MLHASIDSPLISVALPTYERDAVLVDTIKALLEQKFDSFELIVVDQTNEHDETTKLFMQKLNDPRMRYFRVMPPSLTAARNFAIAKAAADIILFLDDDIVPEPDLIKRHYDTFQAHPEVIAVAGRVVNAHHAQFQQLESSRPLYFDKYGMGHGSFNCPSSGPCTSFPGGNVSMKVAAIKQVGGFDPSFRFSAVREESDAAFRLRKVGDFYFEANAAILHLAAPTGGTRVAGLPADGLLFYQNDLLFAFKTVSIWNLPVALAKRFRDVVREQSPEKALRRTVLFIAGAAIALRYRLFPADLVSKEVSRV